MQTKHAYYSVHELLLSVLCLVFFCLVCIGLLLPVHVSFVSSIAIAAETEEQTSQYDSWGDITDTSFHIQVSDFSPGGTQFLDDDTDGTQ